jgi:hypothetical protein
VGSALARDRAAICGPAECIRALRRLYARIAHGLRGGEYAPWRSTVHAIRTDAPLWQRMHLENWNSVPPDLRAQGLDALLEAIDR